MRPHPLQRRNESSVTLCVYPADGVVLSASVLPLSVDAKGSTTILPVSHLHWLCATLEAIPTASAPESPEYQLAGDACIAEPGID